MNLRPRKADGVEVYALGEVLIDFVATNPGRLRHAPGFTMAPGGAPANVAVGLARLGMRSGFIGKVGADEFGAFLRETLAANGVDVSGLFATEQARTTLAFVSLTEEGERDFLFYRTPGADTLLEPKEVAGLAIGRTSVLHHGSISLIAEPSRSATLGTVEAAKAGGALISFDANFRPALWPDLQTARQGLLLGLRHADLVKLSLEELLFLVDGSKAEAPAALDDLKILEGVAGLRHEAPGMQVCLITLGTQGCFYWSAEGECGRAPGFRVTPVDTNGAGDGFMAGFLYALLRTNEVIGEMARFANAVGALTTTKRGAIPALPTLGRVKRLMAEQGNKPYPSCAS